MQASDMHWRGSVPLTHGLIYVKRDVLDRFHSTLAQGNQRLKVPSNLKEINEFVTIYSRIHGLTVHFFAFEVGCRGLVGKSLRKFLTALELPKKTNEETLTDCAITALKCSRKIFLSRSAIQFRTIMLIF
jgi:hypothetical protein